MKTPILILIAAISAFSQQASPSGPVASVAGQKQPEIQKPTPVPERDYLKLENIQLQGQVLQNEENELLRKVAELNKMYQGKIDEICKVAGLANADGTRSSDCSVSKGKDGVWIVGKVAARTTSTPENIKPNQGQ